MKEFEVWMEGYAATGERSGASLIGKAEAETFYDACIKVAEKSLDRKGRDVPLSIWGCRLFDNEADARKSFG